MSEKNVRHEHGAVAVEYVLLAVLVAAVIVLIVAAVGSRTSSGFDKTEQCLETPTGC